MTETPEDIANLYSRARIEWTRYWDFSASRKQVRQQLRLGAVREPLEWPSPAVPLAEFQSQPKEELPQAQLEEVKIEHPELQEPQAQEAMEAQGPQPEPTPQAT